ncbi:MAG: trypsin-like peptidase domain-containing protein [Solobacterium sp.]|nr:trypsin-like peptidase domain-containing protein [Solobacterium sp.]
MQGGKNMSEFNENRSYDTQYGMPNKEKKSHPVLLVLLCTVLSLLSGALGGWFAMTRFGSGSTVVVQSEEAGTSPATTVNSESGNKTISEVAEEISPSVVEIFTEMTGTSYGFFGGTYTSRAAGSGVIISADGYIITNNHVVENAESITVNTYDGTEYEAVLVGTDSKSDIAVIKVNADNLTPAVIGDSSLIKAGDTAIVVGNPLGTLGGSVTHGIISAASRELVISNESMELIQTDATINSGNSGGGLFDGNGHLIGIVNAKDSGTTTSGSLIEGIGFAIPINSAMDVAQELIEYGRVTNRPMLGVYIQTLQQDTQKYKAGVYIQDTISGGGAEKAGLKALDRIISVDGQEITSYTDLSKVLRGKQIGDTVKVVIERDGEQHTFDVVLTGSLEDSKEG